MNIIKNVFIGTVGTLTTSKIIENKMTDYDKVIQPPIDSVSIIMPAYNEEEFIERSASSIKNQSIFIQYPEYFEFIIVDNGSTDKTTELAKNFTDKVIQSPRGKLSARNLGTRISKGNIIVAVDSDIFYPHHWLNTLLKTFRNPDVVAVSGTLLDYTFPYIPSFLYVIGSSIMRLYYPLQMYGGNCAYFKHLFYNIGMFNENINQFDSKQMLDEEEFNLGKKLSSFGKVVNKLNASCIHLGSVRSGCRVGFVNRFAEACKAYNFGKDRF